MTALLIASKQTSTSFRHAPENMQCLAQELIDRIIDLLAEPKSSHSTAKRALASCTLVAHGWLPRSSMHIFERVTIRPEALERFFDDLDACYRVVENVTDLTLISGSDTGVGGVPVLMRLRPPRLRCIVYQQHLPLLKHADVDLRLSDAGTLTTERYRLARLKLGALDAFALSQLLAHFDVVETLELDPQHRYPFYRARAESPWPVLQHLFVHTLVFMDIAACSALGYVRVLRARLHPCTVKSIAFEGFCADKDAPYVNGALNTLGSGIGNLSLCFYDKDVTVDLERAPSDYHMTALTSCTSLQTVSISFIDCRQQFPWACTSILSYLPPCVSRLTLFLHGPADLRRLVHARLDAFESSLARCDSLETLEIQVTGAAMWAGPERKLFEEMKLALPKVLSGWLAALTSVVLSATP